MGSMSVCLFSYIRKEVIHRFKQSTKGSSVRKTGLDPWSRQPVTGAPGQYLYHCIHPSTLAIAMLRPSTPLKLIRSSSLLSAQGKEKEGTGLLKERLTSRSPRADVDREVLEDGKLTAIS